MYDNKNGNFVIKHEKSKHQNAFRTTQMRQTVAPQLRLRSQNIAQKSWLTTLNPCCFSSSHTLSHFMPCERSIQKNRKQFLCSCPHHGVKCVNISTWSRSDRHADRHARRRAHYPRTSSINSHELCLYVACRSIVRAPHIFQTHSEWMTNTNVKLNYHSN